MGRTVACDVHHKALRRKGCACPSFMVSKGLEGITELRGPQQLITPWHCEGPTFHERRLSMEHMGHERGRLRTRCLLQAPFESFEGKKEGAPRFQEHPGWLSRHLKILLARSNLWQAATLPQLGWMGNRS